MQQEEDEKEIKKKKINGPITWAVEEKKETSRPPGEGLFFIFIFKKNKISKIYGGFEKFQNYIPVAPCLGDRGLSLPGWATGPKYKKIYI